MEIEHFVRRAATELARESGGAHPQAGRLIADELRRLLDRQAVPRVDGQLAGALAVNVEDRLAYEGYPLSAALRPEWVARWRSTVAWALRKAWRYTTTF